MAIKQDKFYRDLIGYVRSRIDAVAPSAVYMSAVASFGGSQTRAVQIIPGVPVAQFKDAGHGLVRETFEIACWTRLLTDHGDENTELITSNTLGLLTLVGEVRDILTQTEISSATTEPIVWEQSSTISVSADHPGWGFVSDRYRVAYELAWGS